MHEKIPCINLLPDRNGRAGTGQTADSTSQPTSQSGVRKMSSPAKEPPTAQYITGKVKPGAGTGAATEYHLIEPGYSHGQPERRSSGSRRPT